MALYICVYTPEGVLVRWLQQCSEYDGSWRYSTQTMQDNKDCLLNFNIANNVRACVQATAEKGRTSHCEVIPLIFNRSSPIGVSNMVIPDSHFRAPVSASTCIRRLHHIRPRSEHRHNKSWPKDTNTELILITSQQYLSRNHKQILISCLSKVETVDYFFCFQDAPR